MPTALSIIPLQPFPLVEPGDDVAGLIAAALQASEVYGFDNRMFFGMLYESNELCIKLLADLSMRLHAADM